jgi:hypothetical protein
MSEVTRILEAVNAGDPRAAAPAWYANQQHNFA